MLNICVYNSVLFFLVFIFLLRCTVGSSSEDFVNVFNVCNSSSYTVSFQVFSSNPKQVTLLVQEVTCVLSTLPMFPFSVSGFHECMNTFFLVVCGKGESLVNVSFCFNVKELERGPYWSEWRHTCQHASTFVFSAVRVYFKGSACNESVGWLILYFIHVFILNPELEFNI